MRVAAAAIAWLLLLLAGPGIAAAAMIQRHQKGIQQPDINLAAQGAGHEALQAWQPARKLLQSTATPGLPQPISSSSSSGSSSGTWPWQPGALLLPAVLGSNSGASGGGVNSWPAWSSVVRWADRNSTPPNTASSNTKNSSSSSNSSSSRRRSNRSSSQPPPQQQQQQPVRTTVSQAPPVPLQPLPEPTSSTLGTLQDSGVQNLLLVAIPVVAVVAFLSLMVCCVSIAVRRMCPELLDCFNSGRSNPGLTTPYDHPLVQTVDVEGHGHPPAAGAEYSSTAQGSTRVRSMQDVLHMWQRHMQRDSLAAVHAVGGTPASYRHTWEMHGNADAPSSSSPVQRSRSSTTQRGWAQGLFRSSTDPLHVPRAQRGQTSSQTNGQTNPAEQDRYARLAPDTADLRDSYISACHAFNRINQGHAAVREGPLRERLRVLRLQLFLRVQAVQQQLAGRALVAWQDVELARDLWEAAEDSASGIPASVNRPKRFPGLAPWLIAELPTCVHTPPQHVVQPAPAAAAAAGGVQAAAAGASREAAEAGPAFSKLFPTSSSSSSRGGKVQPSMQHQPQKASASGLQRACSTHSVTSHTSDTSDTSSRSSHDSSNKLSPPYLSSSSNMEVDAAVSVVPASHKPSTAVTGQDPGATGIQMSHVHRPAPVQQQQEVPDEQSAQAEDHDMSNSCAVCLDPLEAGDLLQRLPPCAHTFHAPCLAAWLANSATCPVCRAVVLNH